MLRKCRFFCFEICPSVGSFSRKFAPIRPNFSSKSSIFSHFGAFFVFFADIFAISYITQPLQYNTVMILFEFGAVSPLLTLGRFESRIVSQANRFCPLRALRHFVYLIVSPVDLWSYHFAPWSSD